MEFEFSVAAWEALHKASENGEVYNLIDKEGWDAGVWHTEPDVVVFRHRDLWCVLRRTPGGHWCGYVAVAPGHPWYGMERTWDVPGEVHGGVTYSAIEDGGGKAWIVGWDAAHSNDYTPNRSFWASPYGVYRDVGYAHEETLSLARQAAAAAAVSN